MSTSARAMSGPPYPPPIERQRLLAQLGGESLKHHPLEHLLAAAVAWAAQGMGTPKGKVMRLLPHGSAFLMVATYGWPPALVGRSLIENSPKDPAGLCVQEARPVMVTSRKDAARRGLSFSAELLDHGIQSTVTAPILPCDGRAWGVLEVNAEFPAEHDEEAVLFLQIFADLLGAAIQRAEAEDLLRDERESYDSILRQLPVGVSVVDAAGRVIRRNDRAAELLGNPPPPGSEPGSGPEMLQADGQPFSPATHPTLRALKGETVHDMIIRHPRPDGSTAWLELDAHPIRDRQGHIVAAAVAFQDIEARLRMERALADRERRYRFLTDSIPHTIWTADATGRLDYVNHRWALVTGLPDDRALGAGWLDVVHPEDREPTEKAWRLAVATGSTYVAEFRVRTLSHGYRWVVSRGLPDFGPDGRVHGWFGTVTDIHQAKAHAQQLADAKAEAERANLAKSKFLAAASHDLRQPMQSLFLFTSALAATPLSNRQKTLLERMDLSLDAQKTLLDSLLDVSKLDARVIAPEIADCPVNTIFEQLENDFGLRRLAELLGLKVTVRSRLGKGSVFCVLCPLSKTGQHG